MYAPDAKDLKILSCIADNADLPYSAIGERTHISKDSVKARLTHLIDQRVILSFIPMVNYSHIRHELFHVLIKFGSLLQQRDDFIKSLKENGHIVKATRVIGEYDFEIQILAKNDQDLYTVLDGLLAHVKKNISRIHTIRQSRVYLYSMQIGKFKKHFSFKEPKSNVKEDNRRIDELDLNILKRLSINAREPYVKLALEMKTTPENIRYRVKKLVESNVIQRFQARINKNALGFNTYILLLDLYNSIADNDVAFLEGIENVYCIKSCVGQWNAFVSFYAKDNAELGQTLENIRDRLKHKLNNFELLILLDRYKLVPVPSGIVL